MKLGISDIAKLIGSTKMVEITTVGGLGMVPGTNAFRFEKDEVLVLTDKCYDAQMSFGIVKVFVTESNKTLAFGTLLRKINGELHTHTAKWATGLTMPQVAKLLKNATLVVTSKEVVAVPAYDNVTREPLMDENGVAKTRNQSFLGFTLCKADKTPLTDAEIKTAIAAAIKE